jgi:hypothetical protein
MLLRLEFESECNVYLSITMNYTSLTILIDTLDELQRSIEAYISTIQDIRQENLALKSLAYFDAETGDVTSIEDFRQQRDYWT